MSSQENNYAYQSYIKDVYIELPDYEFDHSPLGKDKSDNNQKDENFLGREKITDSFLNILLKSGTNNSGSYLVTGYRGMGKTSFVKRVIKEYKKREEDQSRLVEKIDISFAQSDLNESDILKQITNNLIQIAEKNPLLKIGDIFSLGNVFRFVSFALIFGVFYYFLVDFNYPSSNKVDITIDSSRVDVDTIIELKNAKESKEIITRREYIIKRTIDSTNTQKAKPDSNFINRFLKNQKNPINHVINDKSDGSLSKILSYLVLLAFFGLTITYAITSAKSIILYVINNFSLKKVLPFIILIIFYLSVLHYTNEGRFLLLTHLSYFMLVLGYFLHKQKYLFFWESAVKEYGIYKKLKTLQERSNAAITNEQGVQSVSEQLPIGFIQRKVKQYVIKNPKEIEYELIEILGEYSKFKKYKKKFIIVFDELDKVEPALGKGFYYDDFEVSEQTEFSQNKLNEIRKRKNLIINILSTLKYFITVADAKFIFIAGREMFDAALADIADRESFISSIFHHVIYVDSFLKDSHDNDFRTQGITGLVDMYLEQILIPKEYSAQSKKSIFLKKYYDYLKNLNKYSEEEILKVIFILQNFLIYLTYRSNGSPKKLSKLIEEHIISIYEKTKEEKQKWEGNSLKLIIKRQQTEDRKLFLAFPFRQQYRFGFITYLYRPFILAQGQIIKKFSDTILVSTPYLMDHIIKFHPFAFSIENLELIPEIISNNRNPMFRYFIEELIKYLQNNHIRETELGLFDYKFFSKTSNEITYISKLYEEELAAFNFSLDEMSNVKLYIQNKIRLIRDSYNKLNTGENEQGKSVIYSITFLNNLLGDTQYFDQEYDNAIVAYLDGLQLLRNCKDNSFERIILSVKIKLKLGLIYEKMKNNLMALSYYNDAVTEVRNYIYAEMGSYNNLSDSKLDKIKLNRLYKKDIEIIPNSSKAIVSYSEILQIINLPYSASLYIQEKQNVEGISIKRLENYNKDFESIINLTDEKDGQNKIVLSDHYIDLGNLLYYKNYSTNTPNKNQTEPAFEYFVNFNIITNDVNFKGSNQYNKDFRAPFNAFVYYKDAISKLIKDDVNQPNFLDLCIEGSNRIRLFENKYNKTFLKTLAFAFSNAGNCLLSVADLKESKNTLEKYIKLWKEAEHISSQIKELMEITNKVATNIKSNEIWSFLERNQIQIFKSKKHLKGLISNPKTPENEYYLKQLTSLERPMVFWDVITHNFFSNYDPNNNNNHTEFIIFVYYLASRFYSKIGKSASFSFQLRKILQVIRNSMSFENDDNKKQPIREHNNRLIKFIEESLLPMMLEATSWNSGSTDRPQIYKFKYIEGLEDIYHPKEYTKHNYSNISNNPETKEIILFLADIKVRNLDFNNEDYNSCVDIQNFQKKIPEMCLVHPYNGISSQFTRMQELDLQDKINTAILKRFFPGYKAWEDIHFKTHKRNLINWVWEDEEPKVIGRKKINFGKFMESQIYKEFLKDVDGIQNSKNIKIKWDDYKQITANSIFSLIQIINIIKIYGVNPYLSYSYLAHFHRKLGKWLKHYELCRIYDEFHKYNVDKKGENISSCIENMIGKESLIILDATSQFQIALQYYHKAKQMHSNGITYHEDMSNFIYLEGDYDDNLNHFGIALERQKINSQQIRERIKELEKELETSPLYKYDSYANTESFKK